MGITALSMVEHRILNCYAAGYSQKEDMSQMTIVEQFKGRNAGPVVQFIKYGIGGGVATAVHILFFSLMAWLVLPCLTPRELVVKLFGLPVTEISDGVRATRAAVGNLVAFLFSNMTAYLINILWVFKRGRHHWVLEILFFYAVSGVSMVIGTCIQTFLIRQYGMTTEIAFGANLVSALLINFGMRKYVIFKG
jgi:putative flippase GtrA